MSTVTLRFRPPSPINFLALEGVEKSDQYVTRVDVGRLTDQELESAADMVRRAFVENAMKRRVSGTDMTESKTQDTA